MFSEFVFLAKLTYYERIRNAHKALLDKKRHVRYIQVGLHGIICGHSATDWCHIRKYNVSATCNIERTHRMGHYSD